MKTTTVKLSKIIGKGYGSFWISKKRYRVLKGGKGSKKSTTTALNCIFRLMAYPESNLLVVRRVMDTHRSSTFAQLNWAIGKLGVQHLWRSTVSPMEMTYLPTGQKILFRGFDDPLKLASTTVSSGYLCWVWLEEAYEIDSEDDFDKLDLSIPRGTVPDTLFKQTTVTFNPWSEHHWLKKRFFDSKSENVSTYSTTYMDNEFLDETDRAVFERMKRENPRKYAVAGLGEWGISEGLVYENWVIEHFDRNKIGIFEDSRGETIDETWKYRYVFGLDYGYTNDPTAFVAAAVNPIDHVCYIFDEHYERKMLNSDIADMIARKGYRKERIRADSAEPKSNDDLARLGISRIAPAQKGKDSIINGIAHIQEYKLIIHPDCRNTIAELSSYCYGKDRSGNTLNKPIDSDNHLMDALRYAFEDIKTFRPISPEEQKHIYRQEHSSIRLMNSDDFLGGWN